jgi:hypothetical protein
LFNNLSVEVSYLNNAGEASYAYDFSLGHESIYSSKFYWSVGFSYVKKGNIKNYFLPGVKVGYNINF